MKEQLDWNNLGFVVRQTNSIIISRYKDGEWSKPQAVSNQDITINCYAGCLHYANSCFEGLKAFKGKDGRIRLFRPEENARRMQRTAAFIDMSCPSEEQFIEMCLMCADLNKEFIPPYGHNASMYIRPLLIGVNPQLNLDTSTEYLFMVMGNPVGSYSGAAALTSVNAVICRDFDRAAPNGTGSFKLSANYAGSFHSYNIAHALGYKELLFLDPATKTKIDEFGSSNFFGIKDNHFITPLSDSVLPSITNKSLQQIAIDMGMTVEKRVVPLEELETFEEVNACGTAVVITPIWSIQDKPFLKSDTVTREYIFADKGLAGEKSSQLYRAIRAIQDGEADDPHNWCTLL